MEKKIVHLTSAHPRFDIRIFHKQCKSLALNGYNVHLVVADGLKDSTEENVNIHDVGKTIGGRLNRMTSTVKRVSKKALALEGDVYHLHDPELIPVGLTLAKKGFKVIFDAHEDLPKQLRSKPYLSPLMRNILPYIFTLYESYAFRKFSALVGATPIISEKLKGINPRTETINNYPILNELTLDIPWSDKREEVCYLGGIAEIRGIKEVVKSLSFTKARLNLAGKFSDIALEEKLKLSDEWLQVNELGFIDRKTAAQTLSRSMAGVVTFHAYPNHIDAQPNKMFEYMSAGIPIIVSDFPLWKDIAEGEGCGLCVDPLDPESIANAINFLLENPHKASQMGENGLIAIRTKYNWNAEEEKLINLYKGLLN